MCALQSFMPKTQTEIKACQTLNATEWTQPLWGRTPQVGNAYTEPKPQWKENKNRYYIIQDNRQICTPVYPTQRVQDNQPQ